MIPYWIDTEGYSWLGPEECAPWYEESLAEVPAAVGSTATTRPTSPIAPSFVMSREDAAEVRRLCVQGAQRSMTRG